MAVNSELKLIGYISGTHGIKGDLKFTLDRAIECDNNFIGSYLFFEKEKGLFIPMYVENVIEKNNFILNLKELNSINDAEKFIQKKVYIKESDFDNYFYELIDYTLYSVVDNGISLGNVLDVMSNGSYELFKVNIGSKQVWIPNVSRYVKSIDDEKKLITVIDSDVLA